MRARRALVLLFAILCGCGAFVFMTRAPKAPASAPVAQRAEEILVAERPLAVGMRVAAADMRWQSVARDAVPAGALRKSDAPDAVQRFAGATVRQPMAKGDPIFAARLAQGSGGYLASTLVPGMRALAVNLDPSGARSVGGFIFPDDRVDVIVAKAEPARFGQRIDVDAKTLLTGVRVLAIGQQLSDGGGQKTLGGETATLEVTPQQAQELVEAMRLGSTNIWLSLRPVNEPVDAARQAAAFAASRSVTIVGYGMARDAR
ncbi:MAG: Flp pilus assembly protein CpaB [Pseudomonadota bacterium]